MRQVSDVRSSAHLTIGKIAGLAQVSADTLRYYERERLIAPTAKSASGYRLYEREALQRIQFIKQAQQCGFNLAEIRSLLALRGSDAACCRDVRRVALDPFSWGRWDGCLSGDRHAIGVESRA